jgi:hypothetical protein
VSTSETQSISATTTVLESQDQTLIDDVNNSMREDAA